MSPLETLKKISYNLKVIDSYRRIIDTNFVMYHSQKIISTTTTTTKKKKFVSVDLFNLINQARLTLFPLFFPPIIVLIFNSMMESLDSGSLDPH